MESEIHSIKISHSLDIWHILYNVSILIICLVQFSTYWLYVWFSFQHTNWLVIQRAPSVHVIRCVYANWSHFPISLGSPEVCSLCSWTGADPPGGRLSCLINDVLCVIVILGAWSSKWPVAYVLCAWSSPCNTIPTKNRFILCNIVPDWRIVSCSSFSLISSFRPAVPLYFCCIGWVSIKMFYRPRCLIKDLQIKSFQTLPGWMLFEETCRLSWLNLHQSAKTLMCLTEILHHCRK